MFSARQITAFEAVVKQVIHELVLKNSYGKAVKTFPIGSHASTYPVAKIIRNGASNHFFAHFKIEGQNEQLASAVDDFRTKKEGYHLLRVA